MLKVIVLLLLSLLVLGRSEVVVDCSGGKCVDLFNVDTFQGKCSSSTNSSIHRISAFVVHIQVTLRALSIAPETSRVLAATSTVVMLRILAFQTLLA